MKRILLPALLAILILFVFSAPAIAQESTEAPPVATEVVTPPPVETPEPPVVIPGTDYTALQIVVVVLALLLLGVLTVFGVTVVPLVRNAMNTLPPWAISIIRADAPKLLDQLDIATQIPNTDLDDIARARLRKLINEILAENADGGIG